jgi:prephenate dehydrogenase
VGTGLIGASIGLAARKSGVEQVTGWDPDPDALAMAVERGAIDEAAADLGAAVAAAQLAIVAAPVAAISDQVEATLEVSDSSCTVTDVGSTKGAVCERVTQRERFIGGHPIAGSEARGPERATAELFQGATWFLTPVAETTPERYKLVMGFVSAIGAVPQAMDPDAHDRLVALTSHLPHALANLLLNQVGEARVDGHEPLDAAGGSLRDMTRVAGANPRIWIDIFQHNAHELASALAEYRRRIEELELARAASDAGYLARWIGEASLNRRRLLDDVYPNPCDIHRLKIQVTDQPGIFAGITQTLASEGINIQDIDMHHVSPERGGMLELLVAGQEHADEAARLLGAQGYLVTVSAAFARE